MNIQPSKLELCPMCKNDNSDVFLETDEKMHDHFELHKTLSKTWRPEKGNDLFEFHMKCITVLKHIEIINNRLEYYEKATTEFALLPWYKKVFYKFR